LLRLGGIGAAAVVLDAWAGGRRLATAPAAKALTGRDWSRLAKQLSGHLSLPSSPSYGTDLELYDPRFDVVHPAGIAFCANKFDVARCVSFAREHRLALAPRSGGHSYGGYSTTTGLVIDLGKMSSILVRVDDRSAVIGAGASLIDVYSSLAAQGVSIPAGSCPTVGIAGLALGGGIGVLGRMFGLTCDHITRLELVTAAGDIVQASPATNPDLYWACRGGGGGNFGVVTKFEFATFPVMPLHLFSLDWPWASSAALLPAWLEWVSSAPHEMWSNLSFAATPGYAEPTAHVGGVWAGGTSGAQVEISKLISAVGQPSAWSLAENDFKRAMFIEAGCEDLSQVECHLAGTGPGGELPRSVLLAKSDMINGPLSTSGVDAVLKGIRQRQAEGAGGSVLFDSWGGAIGRVPVSATAFVHRRAIASAQYLAEFGPAASPAALAAARSWLEEWYASLRPYMSGEAYQNYIDPQLPDWAHAYYGSNLPRLEQVKARWDPDNVFHFAQSIPLAPLPRSSTSSR